VILVRHGETGANLRRCFAESDEVPLTEEGRAQARELGARLAREFRPERVLTSALLRARQTGELIAGELGLNAGVVPGIHERDFGCLKGQPYEEMGRLMLSDAGYDPARFEQWAPEGGESLEGVRIRVLDALGPVLAGIGGREIVVVTHGAVLQALSAHLNGGWSDASVPLNCGVLVATPEALRRPGTDAVHGPDRHRTSSSI